LFPDGNTIAFLVGPNVLGGLGQLSAPASVAPFATAAGGYAVSGLQVLNFTFPASGLPAGTYRAFAAYFGQGSLADNAINNGDLVWLASRTMTAISRLIARSYPGLDAPEYGP